MNVAMIMQAGHAFEGCTTLVSLAKHSSCPLRLSIFAEPSSGSLAHDLEKTLLRLNPALSLTWIPLRTESREEARDENVKDANAPAPRAMPDAIRTMMTILRHFAGQKSLLLRHEIVLRHNPAALCALAPDRPGIAGLPDHKAALRRDALFLPAGVPYIDCSLLWLNPDEACLEACETRARASGTDHIAALLAQRPDDMLNRAFAGLFGMLPLAWKQQKDQLCLCDPQRPESPSPVLRLADDEDKRKALRHDALRMAYLRNTVLYDRFAARDSSPLGRALHTLAVQAGKTAEGLYAATLKGPLKNLKSRVERNHAQNFRQIRDILMERHAEQSACFPLVGKRYDTVFSFDDMRFFQGDLGVRATCRLLFSSRNMQPAGLPLPPGRNAAFFHTLRNARIQQQIAILLAASGGSLDCYFVETGLLCCVTNVNNASIPMRFRMFSSYIVDDKGFYFDATIPTRLEGYLNSGDARLCPDEEARAIRFVNALVTSKLSKYNYQPMHASGLNLDSRPKVLVVDQSKNDASISRGLADATTFQKMLEAALQENPEAEILVKTHPDSLNRGRGAHYAGLRNTSRIRRISESINPHLLLDAVESVYVCSSLLGLEALFHKKPVHVFGMPFYAGWGLTHDRQRPLRPRRPLTLHELVHAVYMRFTTYFDPLTGECAEAEPYAEALRKLRDEYFTLYDQNSLRVIKEETGNI